MTPLKKVSVAAAFFAVLVSGCATQSRFVADRQDYAIQNATTRGRADLSCREVNSRVVSSTYLKAPESGEWQGQERAEFVVGVEGCDKKASYVVVCPAKADACQAAQTPWK